MLIGTKYLIWALSALALLLVTFSSWTVIQSRFSGKAPTSESSATSSFQSQTMESDEIVPPQMTETMKKVLEESKGFQALVSYTDQGFEPFTLSIKKGETVRFTNNSSRDVWVASSGKPYPGGNNSCGQSAFDSCLSLKPFEFWEFTFNQKGEWKYIDNLHKEFTGTVRVQ